MTTLTDRTFGVAGADRGTRTERWRVRRLASSLDAQIAAGVAPADDRLRALRSELLIAPHARGELRDGWSAVLVAARRPAAPRSLRAPLCRRRIIAAEPFIDALIIALQSPSPVAPRGVALARRLLTDGTGPLYNPHSPIQLDTALLHAVHRLAPQ